MVTRAHLVLIGALLLTLWVYAPMRSAALTYEDVMPTPLTAITWWMPRALTTATLSLQTLQSIAAMHTWQIAVHLATALLIAGVLEPIGLWPAVLAASVYALHPLNVETVAPLAYRADLLVVFGVLIALYGTRYGLLWSLPGIVIAILAKESGIVVFPLLAVWRGDRRAAWLLVPMLLLGGALAWCLLPRLASWTAPAEHGAFWVAAINAAAVWTYAAMTVIPVGLTIDHPFAIGPALALTALVASVAVLAITARQWARVPAAACGAWWIALALAPRFLVPLPDYLKEHHWSLPLAGICLAGGLAGATRG